MNDPIELLLPEGVSTTGQLLTHFRAIAQGRDSVTVVVPLPSIGNANSPIDVAHDFSEASFIVEELARCAQQRSFEWQHAGHIQVLHLHLSSYRPELLSQELARMALLLDFPNVEVESLREEHEVLVEEFLAHEDELPTRDLVFPELADLYFINLVRGAYYDWDPEVVAEDIKLRPERRYGFIVSRSISSEKGSVLCSGDEWIITSEVGLQEFMGQLDHGPEELLPSAMLLVGGVAIFAGAHAVVRVAANTVLNALACGDDYVRRTGSELDAHDLLRFHGLQFNRDNGHSGSTPTQVLIGEFATCVVIHCDGYSVVFLNVAEVQQAERRSYADQLTNMEVSMRDGEPSAADISIPWSQIDDEMFEQLCFDYLFAHPDFDKDRLEKIGKSRSRDGGRDIVAWTIRDRVKFREPTKYIFQCKHIGPDSSLTPTRHLQAIGDTIEQYSAQGYGVMCSGYIDATLHDRVDAITSSRGLEPSRKIDRFHLERFLARRPHLVSRYFGLGVR